MIAPSPVSQDEVRNLNAFIGACPRLSSILSSPGTQNYVARVARSRSQQRGIRLSRGHTPATRRSSQPGVQRLEGPEVEQVASGAGKAAQGALQPAVPQPGRGDVQPCGIA